jgi:hypothetical protein
LSFNRLPEVLKRIASCEVFCGLQLNIKVFRSLPKSEEIRAIILEDDSTIFDDYLMYFSTNLIDVGE